MFGWFKRKKEVSEPALIPVDNYVRQYNSARRQQFAASNSVPQQQRSEDSGFGSLIGGIVAAELISEALSSSSDTSSFTDTSSSFDTSSSSSDSFSGFDGGSSGGGGSDSSW